MSTPQRSVVVIHDHADPSIALLRRVARRLRPATVRFITADRLLLSDGFVHTLDVPTPPLLADADLVINRVREPFASLRRLVHEHDLDYALAELRALYVSVLKNLRCPILNPPQSGLNGGWRSVLDWNILGAACGLQCGMGASDWNGSARVVVFEGECHGGPPKSLQPALRRFQRRSGFGLVELGFAVQRNEWRFVGADPTPDLRSYGPALCERILEAGA